MSELITEEVDNAGALIPGDVAPKIQPKEEEAPSLWEGVKASFPLDTFTGALVEHQKTDELFLFDSEDTAFIPTEETIKIAKEEWGIRDEDLPELARSSSERQFNLTTERLLRAYDREETLSRMTGAKSFLVRGGVGMVGDPITWGAAFVSAPQKTIQGGRAAAAVRGGAYTAAYEGVYSGALANVSPVFDWDDVVYSTAGAFVLGGTISGATHRGHAGMDAKESVEFDRLVEAAGRRGTAKEVDSISPSSSAGAKQVETVKPINEAASERLKKAAEEDPAYSFASKVRFDNAGRLGSSPHPMVRALNLGEDGAGKVDGAVNPYSVSELRTREIRAAEVEYNKVQQASLKDYAKELGARMVTPKMEREFGKGVAKALRDPDKAPTPHHARAADAMRKVYSDALTKLKEAGVEGFENIPTNPRYMPRIIDRSKLTRLVKKYGDDGVARLVAGAIRSSDPEVPIEEAFSVGKAYVKTARSAMARSQQAYWASAHSPALRDEVVAELSKELGDEAEDTIQKVIDLVMPEKTESGSSPRARRRTRLDESYEADIETISGGVLERVPITDLYDDDALSVMQQYLKTTMGQYALAKNGIKSKADWERIKSDIAQTVDQVPGYSRDKADADLRMMDGMYKHITGRPVHEVSEFTATWTDRVTKYNFARVMNQTGFAQFSEVGMAVSRAGVTTFLKNIPALRSYIKSVKAGTEAADAVSRDIEKYWGFGANQIRGQSLSRHMDVDGSIERSRGTKIDDGLHMATNITTKFSGLGPITDGLQFISAKAFLNKWADNAVKGTQFLSKKRLAHLGISEDLNERIKDQLKSFSRHSDEEGLGDLNLDDWDDFEAKDALIAAVDRETRRVIQENDIGTLSNWMTHPASKILLQFRTFSIGSYSKHLLFGLNQKDAMAFQEFSASMVGALIGYIAKTHLASIGRDDREEYLEERLSKDALAAAAIYRSTHASFLPGVVDTVAQSSGYDPIFGYARNTGLSSGDLMANPTLDLFVDVMKGTGGTARAIIDPNYDFSQQQWRDLTGSLAFQNMLGIQNALNVIGSELPETSE